MKVLFSDQFKEIIALSEENKLKNEAKYNFCLNA
jgi:hypothetical protein